MKANPSSPEGLALEGASAALHAATPMHWRSTRTSRKIFAKFADTRSRTRIP
jgi:hypothetical protein